MHTPVLLKETFDFLNIKKGETVVDATADGGGHLEEILKRVGKDGIVVAIDQDEMMISHLKKRFENEIHDGRLKIKCGNFKEIDEILKSFLINEVDVVLFDLGMSSAHFEKSGRGFSFLKPEEPLFMNYKSELSVDDLTAREILNIWDRKDIEDVLKNFGDENFFRRITDNIIKTRKEKTFAVVRDLVEVVEESVPDFYKHRKIHFATKTFQALRIAVNDEFEAIKEGLRKSFSILKKEGRIAVISFHSSEDRIIKNFFRDKKQLKEVALLTSKPIPPSREEILKNPRSRSAKLRVLKKN